MIKIQYEEDKNRAAAYDGETEIGESTYSPSEDMWIIDHTLVDATYGGKGIAGKLVAKLVEKAREKDIKNSSPVHLREKRVRKKLSL
ncbi:GNAT family N-acetyltransferase [Levyella massiliensis]|uniref:GNAT family N-acetyltransferase n=1 Tax=Levyella massiliensis TaxID=938289 RepID=UPI001FA71A29|nr:GNAT family N-acetyltransferase [Levyella massiliensis]